MLRVVNVILCILLGYILWLLVTIEPPKPQPRRDCQLVEAIRECARGAQCRTTPENWAFVKRTEALCGVER